MKKLSFITVFVFLSILFVQAQQAKYVFYFIGDGMGVNYNPQIEMFARFKTKSSFHKTKRII